MKENDLIELDIVDNGMNFEGVARYNEKVVFVPGAIKGEKILAQVVKTNSNYTLAKIKEILVKSKDRVCEDCMSYHSCGGCNAMHMNYDATLKMKKEIVKNALRKQSINDNIVESVYGMGVPYYYRNKVQYPVRNIKGRNVFGMFSEKSHKLVEVYNCKIQDKTVSEIARYIFECINEEGIMCYDEIKKVGDIKNIMVRKGIHTDEVLCILVATSQNIAKSDKIKNICHKLIERYKQIKGIVININETTGNVILGDKNIVVYGENKITDKIGDYTYYISTNSFFQVNTVMAEVLYTILSQMLKLNREETVLELYSGVGTIGIFLADKVKQVYGVEIVKDAVKMAEENIKLNEINNATYIAGDAKIELENFSKNNIIFDTVIVDPPRKGLDEQAIDILIDLKPKKIGYVSCNPATLARDLNKLQGIYDVQKIDLFDLFPWTSHVESVVLMSRVQK